MNGAFMNLAVSSHTLSAQITYTDAQRASAIVGRQSIDGSLLPKIMNIIITIFCVQVWESLKDFDMCV